MDLRHKYEQETGKIRADSHFTDEYVEWLEVEVDRLKVEGNAKAIEVINEEISTYDSIAGLEPTVASVAVKALNDVKTKLEGK